MTRSDRAALNISAADAIDPFGTPVGVLVAAVTPSSSEAKAGMAAGDLITGVNGKKVTSLADLQALVAQLTPGAMPG